MDQAKLSIVIVNWNTANYLKTCLQSIEQTIQRGIVKVYVVDNNSSDDSVEMVKKNFAWVDLIANKENLGFAKANNQVLKKNSTEYSLILNPDTKLTKGSVEELTNYLSSHLQVGAAGPMLLNVDGSIQKKGYYHCLPSLPQALLFYTDFSRLSFKSKFLVDRFWETDLKPNQIKEVDQIPGACLLIRKKVLKEVGYFDEDYPLWFEDVDLCFKLRERGYELMFVPQAKVFHAGGASFEKWTDQSAQEVRFYKSLFIFFDKHTNLFTRLLIRVIILGNLIYLVLTKATKQALTPANQRKIFIRHKLEVIKCLLV